MKFIIKVLANLAVFGTYQLLCHYLFVTHMDSIQKYLYSFDSNLVVVISLLNLIVGYWVIGIYLLVKDWTPYLKLEKKNDRQNN